MRVVRWLHISDIHARSGDEWAQRVVLEAMCRDLEGRKADSPVDFILVTGDLAYSGKAAEYALVGEFLDDLASASGVTRSRIYCIPGNHDIDRDRQTFCFSGARRHLEDRNRTDSFLGDPASDNFEALLTRQRHFREFRDSYFAEQERHATDDGLAYVSHLTLEGIRLAILGLDTAWLANGGFEDHMKLLLGERQIMNALRLVRQSQEPPHIVVAMGHHPLHLLREFDRRVVQSRIEDGCHFYHCGHLHDPEERPTGQRPSGCLVLAAGASFEDRQSPNAYTLVTLDLERAERLVEVLRYNPNDTGFTLVSGRRYRIDVAPLRRCGVGELGEALASNGVTEFPYYLAALLLDMKAEIPIPTEAGHTFGSLQVLEEETGGELVSSTTRFFAFRNTLRVYYGRQNLDAILEDHGSAVVRYSEVLLVGCEADPSLRDRLEAQEKDARALAGVAAPSPFIHTIDLLSDLAEAQEWDELKALARRHVRAESIELRVCALRALAFAQAQSADRDDKLEARDLYQTLREEEGASPTDTANLATVLIDLGHLDEAGALVIQAIPQCPAPALDRLASIGERVVEATGDRAFRIRLQTAIDERDLE